MRIVNTQEDLDVLSFKSIIEDAKGRVFHRWFRQWVMAGPTLLGEKCPVLPVTVHYEGLTEYPTPV